MLSAVLNRRLLAIALALLLLITQHLGLQHLLGHALQGDVAARGQATLSARAADGAAAGAGVVAAHGAGEDTADDAADGLCKLCLLLATLGVASLPALLQWRASLRTQALRVATALRQWAAPALHAYQARAPPH